MLSYKGFVRKALAVALISGMCFASFQTPAVAAQNKELKKAKINKQFGFETKEEVEVTQKFIKKSLPISKRYDAASEFYGDVAFVQKNNRWGLIDRSGVEIIHVTNFLKGGVSVDNKDVYKFTEGFITYKHNEGKIGYITFLGHRVLHGKYDEVREFEKGFAVVGKNVIIPATPETPEKVVTKYGVINNFGKEVTNFVYDDVEVLTDHLFKVNVGGKYGLVNKFGQEVLAPMYKDISEFGRFFAVVTKTLPTSDRVGLVNKMGMLVVDPIYDAFEDLDKMYVKAWDQNRVGLIDPKANLTVRPIYDQITNFKGHFAKMNKDGKWGLVNRLGVEVQAPQFDEIKDCVDGYMQYKKDGKVGYLNPLGVIRK